MKKINYYISNKLLKIYIHKFGNRPQSRQLEKELAYLNPGKNSSEILSRYVCEKISKFVLAFLAFVIITVFLLFKHFVIDRKDILSYSRNSPGKGDYDVEVNLKAGEDCYPNFKFTVEERRLDKNDYDQILSEAVVSLDNLMLADNQSLLHINSDLNLVNAIDGFPFDIRWESSDYTIINDSGTIGNDIPLIGEEVILRAIIVLDDTEYRKEYRCRVYPRELSDYEYKKEGIEKYLKHYEDETRNDYDFVLPDSFNGEALSWKKQIDLGEVLLIFISMFVPLLIWKGTDYEVKKKYESRNRKLLIEYAEFVGQLQIMLTSGATIRFALERMNNNYLARIKEGGEKKYVYEELRICINKLHDGMNEPDCYKYFGERCNLQNYKKLSSLLVQNLKKGNEGLIIALENETNAAFEERTTLARKMGEEAKTKLLFPMILMLCVVMIIIMIPAYLSFGGM